MPSLPSSNHPEPGNREANDLGEAQMSKSERSPDIGDIGDVNSDKAASLISYTERVESYSGPLPNPAMLRDYEELYPKATELLFAQFFKVTEHNMLLETKERKFITSHLIKRESSAGRER